MDKIPTGGRVLCGVVFVFGVLFSLFICWHLNKSVDNIDDAIKVGAVISTLKNEIAWMQGRLDDLESDSPSKEIWSPTRLEAEKMYYRNKIGRCLIDLQNLERKKGEKQNPPGISIPPKVFAAGM